jgi:lipopolysaccharide export system protein LptC
MQATGVADRIGVWFPLLLIAMLASLTFWLDRVMQPQPAQLERTLRHAPDYIVQKISGVTMDSTGNVKHKLDAQRMVHFPDDNTTHLVEPKFVSYTQARAPITVTAREATVSSNGENIYFTNDVRVVRAADASQSELVLETNYLHVIPDDYVAKTDQPVTIRNATAVVTASGLELNSETRTLQLYGRVKGVFNEARRQRSAQH